MALPQGRARSGFDDLALPENDDAVGDRRGEREVVDDQQWLENDFIPTVSQRGAAIIEARGSSSAASAASAMFTL